MAVKKKSSVLFGQIFSFKNFLVKYKIFIFVAIIFFVSFTLRFYHFSDRWGLGNDDSRDVAIAQQALARKELPLTGSFSSAGPFVFGPFFYWFLMLSYLLVPHVFTIPWILIGLIGVLNVFVLMYAARKFVSWNYAFFVGAIAATSPQLIARSLSLGQHTFVALFSSLTILCLILLLEKKKIRYALLMGLCIGSAINFHYSALNLLLLIFAIAFVPFRSIALRVIGIFVAVFGVLLALSPLLFWDAQQSFANTNNLLDYFLIGQYRLYVPNSWHLFLINFLPSFWSFVVGGYAWIALLTMGFLVIVYAWLFIQKNLPQKFLFLIIPFVLLLLLNRYYRGERSEGYLLYLQPFIFLLTAYGIYAMFQKGSYRLVRQIIAGILFLLIIGGNSFIVPKILAYQHPVPYFEHAIDSLVHKYPHQQFKVYDWYAKGSYLSQPISLLLSKRHMTSESGMPIGVVLCSKECPTDKDILLLEEARVVDLRTEPSLQQNKKEWVAVNPENMYDDLPGWLSKHQLKSTFSLVEYLEMRQSIKK